MQFASPHRSQRTILAASIAILLFYAGQAKTSWAGFRENFEDDATSWQFVGADAPYQIRQHYRPQQGAHWGHRCELIKITAGYGTYAHFQQPIPHARVIDELRASLWVRSSKSGVQMLARVVFPRNLHPETGQPLTALVRGSSCDRIGTWQKLEISDFPLATRRQVRVLRQQHQVDVDPREAYVDAILLNVYGGEGETTVAIDDLEIEGLLEIGGLKHQVSPAAYEAIPKSMGWQTASSQDDQVSLQGSTMLVRGRAFFPRAIDCRGESFRFLAGLGFNTIRLHSPATPHQLESASELGIHLICPPPPIDARTPISPRHRSVIAWTIASPQQPDEFRAMFEWVSAIRKADPVSRRPVVCLANQNTRAISRAVDIVLYERSPWGTATGIANYPDWLRQQRRLARPGTNDWAVIHTATKPSSWSAQYQARATSRTTGDQLRLLAFSAVSSGTRGLVFASSDRLDQQDPQTRQRADALKLINAELSLIEPWLVASGEFTPVETRNAAIQAAILETQRSHLLLVLRNTSAENLITASQGVSPSSLIVPAAPESSTAFWVTPVEVKPLRTQRVTGGLKVSLNDLQQIGILVFAQHGIVYGQLAQQVSQTRPVAAKIKYATVSSEFELAKDSTPSSENSIAALTRTTLSQAQRSLQQGDYIRSYEASAQASQWLAKMTPASAAASSRERNNPPMLNVSNRQLTSIGSGDMESLTELTKSGWRHFQSNNSKFASRVELSPYMPHAGNFSLAIEAAPSASFSDTLMDSENATDVPPVWICSAPVSVRKGDWVEIHGWIRIPSPIGDNQHGVLIFDSHGGIQRAQRFDRTQGWQNFEIRRQAVADIPLTVTFALEGIGKVYLDDVSVQSR